MGYSTFTSLGVKEVLLGLWDLLCDGYLLIPSSLFASLVLFTIPVAAGNMGLQVLNAVGLALVGDHMIGCVFPLAAATVFQAYLSRVIQKGNWDNVRSTFQRTALIWLTIFLLIHVPILCNWDLILMLVGQDHQLAHIAQIFIFIQLPRYFAMFVANLCLMTLYAQDSVWPTLLANFLNFVLIVIAEVLVVSLHASVYLLALGVCVAQIVTTAVVIGIFLIKEWQWDRLDLMKFQANSFFDWYDMFCQTILSIVQQVANRCIIEVVVLMGGILSLVELGAATLLRRYTAFVNWIPLNLIAPVVTKSIGASIGKRSHISVRVYIFSALLFTFILGFILTIINVIFRKQIASFMTNEKSVITITADLTINIMVAIMDWLLLVYMTNIFIFRGLGSMAFATITSFCLQYGLGLPLSIILVFIVHMHLSGYYLALSIAYFVDILVGSEYLQLFKLPALVVELETESNERQPLIENEISSSSATATAPATTEQKPLIEKKEKDSPVIAPVEAEYPQPSPTDNWSSRCCLLVFASILINCLAVGIHFFTNFLMG